MSNTLVVYRNPLEEAMWNSVMGGGESSLFIFLNIVLLAFCTVVLMASLDILSSKYGKPLWFIHFKRNHAFILFMLMIIPGYLMAKLIKFILVIGIPIVFNLLITM